jgi:hypothetical protein
MSKMRPNAEDIQRLRRLSEEVRSRVFEINLIMTHIAQMPHRHGQAAYIRPGDPKKKTQDAGAGDWMEIIVAPDGTDCCYGEIGGKAFAECPCGAS